MDLESKEVVISLNDVDALIDNQNKNLLALFIEVDGELVDVLVYAIKEHFAIIPYKAQRSIKFTLRDIHRHEKVGDARIKMGLLSNMSGPTEHTIYLDGLEKYRLTEQSAYEKPWTKFVYEWKDADEEPEREEYTGDSFVVTTLQRNTIEVEKRMRQAETDLQYVVRDLIESLKRDTKDSDLENSAKTQELENQLLQLIQVTEFNEVTNKQNTKTNEIYENAREFSRTDGDNLRKETDSINSKIRDLELRIRTADDGVTDQQSSRRDLEGRLTTHEPVKVSPSVATNLNARSRTKEEVAGLTRDIADKTLSNVRKMKEDSLLWGLDQTKVKTALFDDILTQELTAKESKDKAEGVKVQIRANQAEVAAREFDLMLLEQESKKYGQIDRDLTMRIREGNQALDAMLGDRKDASDRGNELEARVSQYEALLEQIEREVNELREESDKRSKTDTKGLFANLGLNNPEIKALQSDLSKAEAERDQALDNLERMEGAWIESVEEVSKEAEILAADSGDKRFRTEVEQLLKDIVASSKRSADLYQNLEATDQQITMYKIANHNEIAHEFAADVKERNKQLITEEEDVVNEINLGVNELNEKIQAAEAEQQIIPPLQDRLDDLLRERAELESLLEELILRKQQREKEDEERERQYQRDLEAYNKRIDEINKEIKQLRGQIADAQKTIDNLRPVIADLQNDVDLWEEKIQIKHTINKKRKVDDELEDEYVPVPNDPIDIKIANYKNKKITLVPIKRIGQGEYMFATMRIIIKLDSKQPSNYSVTYLKTNHVYDLDEFIKNEGKKELEKLQGIHEDHELVVDDAEKTELRKQSPDRKSAERRTCK